MNVSRTKLREDVELTFQYWKIYSKKGQSGSVAFHFADASGGDVVAWFNASLRYERGPKAGEFLSPSRDFGRFRPPANGAFAIWYRNQGWKEPRQWSEVSRGLRCKLNGQVWVASLIAKQDSKKNRIIWQVQSGTLRIKGSPNLALERLVAERDYMEGQADAPIMFRSQPTSSDITHEVRFGNAVDFGVEIPF